MQSTASRSWSWLSVEQPPVAANHTARSPLGCVHLRVSSAPPASRTCPLTCLEHWKRVTACFNHVSPRISGRKQCTGGDQGSLTRGRLLFSIASSPITAFASGLSARANSRILVLPHGAKLYRGGAREPSDPASVPGTWASFIKLPQSAPRWPRSCSASAATQSFQLPHLSHMRNPLPNAALLEPARTGMLSTSRRRLRATVAQTMLMALRAFSSRHIVVTAYKRSSRLFAESFTIRSTMPCGSTCVLAPRRHHGNDAL